MLVGLDQDLGHLLFFVESKVAKRRTPFQQPSAEKKAVITTTIIEVLPVAKV
jgi:hypothetical protein